MTHFDKQKHEKLTEDFDKLLSCSTRKVKFWKDPIRAKINSEDYKDFSRACIYFTGSDLEVISEKNNELKVEAEGYYNAIGA